MGDAEQKLRVQMDSKQAIGVIGSAILFVGVFCPIVSLPIIGGMNYFQNGKGDGAIILILAVASLVLVLSRQYKFLWITGTCSLATMIYTFMAFQMKLSQASSQLQKDLSGNPFKGLADMAFHSVQLQWGWALLVVGAALIITCAMMKGAAETQLTSETHADMVTPEVGTKKCPACAETIRLEAKKCRFCGEVFQNSEGTTLESLQSEPLGECLNGKDEAHLMLECPNCQKRYQILKSKIPVNAKFAAHCSHCGTQFLAKYLTAG